MEERAHRHIVVLLETDVFGTLLYHVGVVEVPEEVWKLDQALTYQLFGSSKVWLDHAKARENAERYAQEHNLELVETKLACPLPSLKEALLCQLQVWTGHISDSAHRDEEPLTWGELRRVSQDLSTLLELVITGVENH